jgi:hypothetical protein
MSRLKCCVQYVRLPRSPSPSILILRLSLCLVGLSLALELLIAASPAYPKGSWGSSTLCLGYSYILPSSIISIDLPLVIRPFSTRTCRRLGMLDIFPIKVWRLYTRSIGSEDEVEERGVINRLQTSITRPGIGTCLRSGDRRSLRSWGTRSFSQPTSLKT